MEVIQDIIFMAKYINIFIGDIMVKTIQKILFKCVTCGFEDNSFKNITLHEHKNFEVKNILELTEE